MPAAFRTPPPTSVTSPGWSCPAADRSRSRATSPIVGHQNGPEGTTILDISDPRKPKIVSRLMTPNFVTHTHKVRVVDDLMFTNSEYQPGTARAKFDDPGFCIYNVKDKTNPKLVKFMRTHGKGVHRFDLDEHLRLYLDRGGRLRRQHPGHLRHPRSVEPDRGRAAGG